MASCFIVFDVVNGDNNGILPKDGTYYRAGLIDGIKILKLGIPLGAYDPLEFYLIDWDDKLMHLKQ